MKRRTTRLALALTLALSGALPALASHGQSSDTDSENCLVDGWLASRGYGHQWQLHVHDGVGKNAPDSSGWYWATKSWGFHDGTQYVSVVAGGPSTIASALCTW